ncbi:MAG: hypothetical protein S0880_37015 [Actinomycetota bacterium]|nr:hypothetical protein [Actinomycetota bacterium]
MRVGARGLPVLIAALIATATASSAGASDETGVGVVNNVVQVAASATSAGASRQSAGADCTYAVVIDDDLAVGVYELDFERLYSDTGRWLSVTCDGEEVVVDGQFIFPEGGGFAEADLLEQALRSLDPPEPTWGSSPDGIDVPMVVQLPTWLWVDTAYWDGTFAARAVTPSGRMWAEAKAVPASTTWSLGDGTTVVCTGARAPTAAEAGCSHTYRHSTAGTGGFVVSATVEFEVWGSTSLSPAPVLLGTITRASAPVSVEVVEIQAVETRGR